MPAYDTGFKIVARTAGRELAALAGLACTRWTPLVSEVQTTERLADRAFRAASGRERFVVYMMEGYTYWDKSAPWNILAKSALLSERERLPTRSFIFVLRPRGYRPQQGRFFLRVGKGLTQQVWFSEICLWKLKPQAWWERIPGLMALYPLSHHPGSPVQAVAHAAEVIATHETDGIVRADLLTTLAIFGRLAYPRFDMLQIIGRERMRESKVYQQIKDEGRTEGRTEGQLEAQRALLLDNLDARFGPAACAEFASDVNRIGDSDRLMKLHRFAISCSTPEEFRRHFRGN